MQGHEIINAPSEMIHPIVNNIIRKRNFLLHLFTKLFSILVQGWKQGQDKPLKGTL